MSVALRLRHLVLTGVLTITASSFAIEAVAQSLALEEIVVTTRKRTENLQDVPLVITTFTEAVLDRKGLNTLEDVARLTAGVTLEEIAFPQDIRITIRGLSPSRGRPNVAILQDGIDVSSESVQSAGGSLLINPRLFDIERVEIVKGPQSALYGRSAFAGAINYVTKKPTNEWENKLTTEIGDYGNLQLSGGIYGPITEDKLLLGLNAAYWTHDGFYNNSITGGDTGGTEGVGFSGTTIFNLTEDVSLNVRAEYTDDSSDIPSYATIDANTNLPLPPSSFGTVISPAVQFIGAYVGETPAASDVIIRSSENPRTGTDYPGSNREIFRVSATLEVDFDWGSFTSRSHLADANTFQFLENRRVGSLSALTTMTEFNIKTGTNLASQEFQLASNDDSDFRWMIGAIYWDEEITQESRSMSCLNNQLLPFLPILPCGPFVAAFFTPASAIDPNIWIRNTEHTSVFGSLEYSVSDNFAFSVEARYVDESLFVSGPSGPRIIDALGLFGPPNVMPGATPNIDATDSDSYFTPRFTLEYTANDDMMLYASVAKGAKPSGISTVGAGAAGFDPELFAFDQENMWVYEIGAKTSWNDGRFVANTAFYYEDFKNKQTSSQVLRSNGLLGTKTVNASDAEIKGLEVDLAWVPVDGLNLSLGYSFIDSEYKNFVVTSGGAQPIAAVGNCNPVNVAGSFTCELDRSGKELEDVSKHSLVASASYRVPISSDLEWLIGTDIQYSDNRFDTADNRLILPGYWLVDLRVGISAENWDIIAFADNLLDDDTIRTAFATPDFQGISLAFFPPPFTFVLPDSLQARLPNKQQLGVRATYRF